MKVLLDEDLDYRLAQSFPTGFDVCSTQWMEWSSAAEEIARAIFPAAKPPDPSKRIPKSRSAP